MCFVSRLIQNTELTQIIQNRSIYYSAYSKVSISNDYINSIVKLHDNALFC